MQLMLHDGHWWFMLDCMVANDGLFGDYDHHTIMIIEYLVIIIKLIIINHTSNYLVINDD